ncbi:hypothetical protein [Flavobacterium sp. GCM10023249]|uniref:hypothetical protein n=1 Tax=unclassified Flavobacterium TaxID=196869 RepID=UPI003611DB28
MLQNIMKLDGAEGLSKKEQLNISGAGKTPPSLCAEPLLLCSNERTYDPCAPFSPTNYPC